MEEINLKDFWEYYKRYIAFIIIVIALCVSAIVSYDVFLKKPMYSTSTTILLVKDDEKGNSSSIEQSDIALNQKLVATYTQIIKSRLVLEQVIGNLNLDYTYEKLSSEVSVKSVDDTEILKITVTDKSAEDAQLIANNITKVFGKEVIEIYNINNVSVIDKAILPTGPSNMHLVKDIVIATLVGFVLSSGIVFVIFYFDDIVRDPDTLEKELELPVLAKVYKDKEGIELIANEKPNAAASESIRNLRTSLQFSSVDKELKTILVTSSVPSDGKSFISANLATSFAQTGKKVLIVDCDLRKGRQHTIFGIHGHKGLSNLLIGDINAFNDFIVKSNIKNLFVLPRGIIPPNPSELLNSKKNVKLLEILKNKFDIIILDGAPVTGLSDSLILSSIADQTIIVSSMNHTPKTELVNAKKALESVGASVAGTVANNVLAKRGTYGGYYYYYGYSEKTEEMKKEDAELIAEEKEAQEAKEERVNEVKKIAPVKKKEE